MCEYGCENEAVHQFKNGKWCCQKKWILCPYQKEKLKGKNNPFYGKTHSKETIKKISNLNKNRKPWNKGIPRKQEVKQKISDKNKGRLLSTETKEKMRKSHIGLLHSDETKLKISKSQKNGGHFLNHTHTEQTKKIMSKKRKNRTFSYTTIKKIKKALTLNIEQINNKYPIFSKTEELRYNPDKLNEIQVHCGRPRRERRSFELI